MLKKIIVVVFLGLLLLTNPVAAEELTVYVMHAPDQSLQGIEQVAILNFREVGNNPALLQGAGQSLGGYIASDLSNPARGVDTEKLIQEITDFRPFRLVERGQLESLLKEHETALAGITDPVAHSIQVGRITNAQAVIIGEITCQFAEREKYKTTVFHGKELFIEKTISLSTNIRLVETETGNILISDVFEQKGETDSPKNEKLGLSPGPSTSEVLQKLLQKSSWQFVSRIAPSFQQKEFGFKDLNLDGLDKQRREDLKSTDKEIGKQIKRARTFSDLVAIRGAYNALLGELPYNWEIHHNLAMVSEIAGNYEEAIAHYNQAVLYAPKDKQGKLQNIITPLENSLSCAPLVESLVVRPWPEIQERTSEKMLAKSSPLYEQPDNNGPRVVDFLPSGIPVKIIEARDDWYHVELPDGQQGYILAANFET